MKHSTALVALAACAASSTAFAKPLTKAAVVGADVVHVAPRHYGFAAISKQASSSAFARLRAWPALDPLPVLDERGLGSRLSKARPKRMWEAM